MKKVFGILLAASLTIGIAGSSYSQPADASDAKAGVIEKSKMDHKFHGKGKELESVTVVGTIQVTPPDAAKKQRFPQVSLKEGDKEYKLIPGKDKKAFGELEKLAGKIVSVSGKLLPANEKFPLPAIKVDSFTQKE